MFVIKKNLELFFLIVKKTLEKSQTGQDRHVTGELSRCEESIINNFLSKSMPPSDQPKLCHSLVFDFCGSVSRWCPRATLCDLMDCSPLDISVQGIAQARIWELVAILFL